MPQISPIDRIRHILENAARALGFIEGRKEEDLETDFQLFYALQHCIQIIGEAANAIPDDFQGGFPGIPSDLMNRMRNRLVHDYDAVMETIVWDTVKKDLPRLVESILAVLPPEQV